MLSRERVERSFAHREADRIPIDFGTTIVTSMDLKAYKVLKKKVGIRLPDDMIIDHTMGTAAPCEQLQNLFHCDFRRVSMNYLPPPIIDEKFTNGFGIVFQKAPGHEYFDVVYNPLQEPDIQILEQMMMPDPHNPAMYFGLEKKTQDLYKQTEYALVADFGVPGFYETSQKLRGYENLACDLLLEPEFIHSLYEKLFELQKAFFTNYLAPIGKYISVVCYADDLGMQDRPQISPQLYKDIIKPWHKAIFRHIRTLTDAKILLHSCGAIVPLLDDLIDAGVDIINPVQIRAAGMEPEFLKKTFGDRLIFWGGLDEQYLLPNGTPEEIEIEAKRLIKIFGENGGYVFAPSHNFQSDTPPENIIAMYKNLDNQAG